MELEDFKSAWSEYDKKLSKHLNINVKILESINFEKYNYALRKPLNLELLNMFIQAITISLVTVFSIRLYNEIPYFLMGVIGALMCTISFAFSAVKAIRFNKLFYNHLSIINYQKDLTELRILIMRFRKIEYVLAGIMGITIFPLFMKAFSGVDLLGNLTVFIPAIFFTLGFGYAIGVWLNAFFYDKGLKDAGKFLNIIDKFEKEE